MLMKLIVCLLGIVAAVPVDKRHFMRFLELSELLQDTTEECDVRACTENKFEMDGIGLTWLRYCYHCIENQTPVLFRREYTQHGWTYVTSKDLGTAEYSYRIVEQISNCQNTYYEVDGQGREWKKWCYQDGEQVLFEKNGEMEWSYVEDYEGGIANYGWRRVVNRGFMVLLQEDEDEQSYIRELERVEEDLGEDLDEIDEEFQEFEEGLEDKTEEIDEQGKEIEIEVEQTLEEQSETLEVQNQDLQTLEEEGSVLHKELEQTLERELEQAFDSDLDDAAFLEYEDIDDIFFELRDIDEDEFSEFIEISGEYTGEDWESVIYTVTEKHANSNNRRMKYSLSEDQVDSSLQTQGKEQHDHTEQIPCICESLETQDSNSDSEQAQNQLEEDQNAELVETVEEDQSDELVEIVEGEKGDELVEPKPIDENIEETFEIVELYTILEVNEGEKTNEIYETSEELIEPEILEISQPEEILEVSQPEEILEVSQPEEILEVSQSEESVKQTETSEPVELSQPVESTKLTDLFESEALESSSHQDSTTELPSEVSHIILLHPYISQDLPSTSSSVSSTKSLRKLVPDFIPSSNCHILEGDVSGRYFWQEYDESSDPIHFLQDSQGNFVWDSAANFRQSSRSINFLEIRPIYTSNYSELPACAVYNTSGELLDFEKDEVYPFFWEIVLENSIRINFIRASSDDNSQGMYKIDTATGLRIRESNTN